MALCSYYAAYEVEKVRTVNYILASSHHDRMRGAMLFSLWVTFCSSKEPGRCRTLNSQTFWPFLIIVYTVNNIVPMLWMLMTWRRNERVHHTSESLVNEWQLDTSLYVIWYSSSSRTKILSKITCSRYRYNVVHYSTVLHRALQWLRQKIIKQQSESSNPCRT